MNKRLNLLIILALTAVGGILLLVCVFFRPSAGSTVLVTVDGKEYARFELGQQREFTIDLGEGEYNTLRMDGEGVEMIAASCRDQLCVHQGKVTAQTASERALGCDIICLPHHVVVTLTDLPAEQDEDIPDA